MRKASTNPHVHRGLHLTPHFEDPMRGKDVRELQKACNARIRNLDLEIRKLKVDGKAGRQTVAVSRRVARHLGVGVRGHGVTRYVQTLIRHPEKRSASQVKRGKRYREAHAVQKCKVNGNSVTGGRDGGARITAGAIEAAHRYYNGQSHRFYSQAGAWTVSHGITGEPRGYRSDCSQFATSLYRSAGMNDPNRNNWTGGYTGTLMRGGRYIRRDQLRPGDLVLYGAYPHHHVEVWVGNGDGETSYAELARKGSPYRDRTVGHGSPPVDYGDIDMQAGPRFVTHR